MIFRSAPISPQAAPAAGFYILVTCAVLILVALISLVEMVVLQLMRWGNTRQSLRASLIMNIPSSAAAVVLLLLFPQPSLINLLIAWPILVMIEGILLTRIRPQAALYNWLATVLANLASYLILILPAFLFRG